MRKTKILATIGPATCEPHSLQKLFEAGCNVVRINMSHSTHEEATAIIANVRTLSDRIGILLDTRGPEVRTTEVEETVVLEAGEEISLRGEDEPHDRTDRPV